MPHIHTYTLEEQDTYRKAYRADPAALLHIDDAEAQRLKETITTFYREHLQESGLDGYAVGLSGGIDSTTVAHLLVDAVGPENVRGVIMPPPYAEQEDIEPALHVAERLEIETNDHEQFQRRIGSVVDRLVALGEKHEDEDVQRMKRGNVLARCRMIVLRDIARANGYLVAGTTNASERDLGYMTLAADGRGGVDNEALYELYKTTERDLAAHLGVPQNIIDRTPTADLWPGQTDADELGSPYAVLDEILVGLRLDLEDDVIAAAVGPIDEEVVENVRSRVEKNRYKTRLAPHPAF